MSKLRGKAGKPKNFKVENDIVFQSGKIKEGNNNYRFFNDPRGTEVEVIKGNFYKFHPTEIDAKSLDELDEGWEKVFEKVEKYAQEGKVKKLKKLIKKLKKKRGEKVAVDLEDD